MFRSTVSARISSWMWNSAGCGKLSKPPYLQEPSKYIREEQITTIYICKKGI